MICLGGWSHENEKQNLLKIIKKLIDEGNTVVCVEHDETFIRSADYIIDIGPEGGDKGGEIVATGTPEEIAKVKESYTGQFLKKIL